MNPLRGWLLWWRVALAVAACTAAVLLNLRAWQVGRDAREMGLLGCYLAGAVVLGLAWLSVFGALRAEVSKENLRRGVSVADLLGLMATIPGCLGCYALWPAAALLMALLFVALALSKDFPGPDRKGALLRVGLASVLFLVTWYEIATITSRALHGLGERIDATVGEERLMAFAADAIASRRQARLGEAGEDRFLKQDEIPDDIHALIGHQPAWTRVDVRFEGGDPYVTISNNTQDAFRIEVRPSRTLHEPGVAFLAWCAQDTAGLQWRPGIYLDTAGNFR